MDKATSTTLPLATSSGHIVIVMGDAKDAVREEGPTPPRLLHHRRHRQRLRKASLKKILLLLLLFQRRLNQYQ